MASNQRRTDDLLRLKTRGLIYQNIDGTYPVLGAASYIADSSGTVGWSPLGIDASGNLNVPGDLTVSGTITNYFPEYALSGPCPSITSESTISLLPANGNVGIGKCNPTVALDVNGDAAVSGDLDVAGTTTLSTLNAVSIGVAGASILNTLTASALSVPGTSTLNNLNAGNTNISTLHAGATNVSTLSVAGASTLHNLAATATNLTTLGVSGASNLATLGVSGNTNLATLGVSGATNLTTLGVSGASNLTTLGVSGTTTLATLGVTGATTLATLGVTGAANLTTLGVSGTTTLATLGVSGTSNLTTLGVSGTSNLTTLGVSGVSNLTTLGVSGNTNLATLGVTGASNLTTLNAGTLVVSDTSTLNGPVTMNDGLTVYGTTNIAELSSLNVLGASTLNGNLDVCGNLTVDGTLTMTDLDLNGNLTVSGISTFAGNVAMLANLVSNGNVSLQSLVASGNGVFAGDLSVLGTTTLLGGLAGDLAVSGNVTADDITVNGSSQAYPPVGSMMQYAGAVAPVGWLLCNGQPCSQATYAQLFGVIGYTYGGTTPSFNVPDMRSRVPIGAGQGAGLSNYGLNQQGGNETVTLTTNQMPVHSHSFQVGPLAAVNSGNGDSYGARWGGGGGDNVPNNYTNYTYGPTPTSTAGGTDSIPILNPYLALNYIIKY